MRIGIISDIHGNLAALDAVLADLERARPDQVVCLGDVAATGPQPRETVARLRALGYPTVLGNADAELLDVPADITGDGNARRFVEIDRWCAAQLTAEDRAYLRTFRPTLELPLGGGHTLLCFHGSPHSYDDIIVATTPEDEIARLLGDADATVMVGGHTHEQLLRRYKTGILLNPGSVGLAFERGPGSDEGRNTPWAEYALVTSGEGGSLEVGLRRAPFDAGAVARAIRVSGMPHAEWLAADWR